MKILVTGAAGFLGSKLLPALQQNREEVGVCGVVRNLPANLVPSVKYVVTDLSAPGWTDDLPDENFDVVIHLAQSRFHREFPVKGMDIFNVNVRSTVELADWSRRHRVKRFLFTSTGNVYGSQQKVHKEDDSCKPDAMYGATKLSAEILLKPYSGFMTILVLRIFGVYGPGQVNAMFPNIIQRFICGDEIILAGDVGVRSNPIFLDDCVLAIQRLSQMPMPSDFEVLNVCGSETIDLKQVSELMERFSGKKAKTRVTASLPLQLVGSNEKFDQLCAPSNGTRFEDGFRKTYNFFNKLY